ncbi:MAG: DUF3000 domain-containing protein [Candidatus Nanopelagicales bacterium]|nr:DUF3000 domain-containing protein [Candidatus Nanopelagicales bacterium]
MRSVPKTGDAFAEALVRVRAVVIRPEFRLDEAPAPSRLAPSALALTAESADPGSDRASGRFVLLHDPDGVDEWAGTFRAVVFVRAALEHDLIGDPLLNEVGWSWLVESLAGAGAECTQAGGTVTCSDGQSFGSMADRPADSFVEIRASWTPITTDGTPVELGMDRHVEAWIDLLAHATGLMPMPHGISQVSAPRRRERG